MTDYLYFMDEMQYYELEIMMDNVKYSNKETWEQTRMLMYSVLSPYLKDKHAKPKDIFPLMTDDDYKEVYEEPKPTKEDFYRLSDMSKRLAKELKNKGK